MSEVPLCFETPAQIRASRPRQKIILLEIFPLKWSFFWKHPSEICHFGSCASRTLFLEIVHLKSGNSPYKRTPFSGNSPSIFFTFVDSIGNPEH